MNTNGISNEVLERLMASNTTGRPLLLLSDYDGTLTPIVPTPEEARLRGETRQLLADLAQVPGVFVGVVSGRAIDDLKQLVNLSGIYYAGTSGLELDLLGPRIDHPDSSLARDLLEEWATRLRQFVQAFEGAWLERKALGMTLHYRRLAMADAPRFREQAHALLDEAGDRLKVLDVSKGIEIIPNLGWDKGTALEFILDDAARHALPFYAGDAANDADALIAARKRGGIAVGVGPEAPSEAEYRFEAPEDLTDLFATFLERSRAM